jgi:LCP family protein required for cell wall assembly
LGKHSKPKAKHVLETAFHARALPRPSLTKIVLTYTASLVTAILIAGSITFYTAVNRIQSSFQTVDLTSQYDNMESAPTEATRLSVEDINEILDEVNEPTPVNIGSFAENFNVLIVGSDTRENQGDGFGSSRGELNDVNILMKVDVVNNNATVVSFPRDLLVDVPECVTPEGKTVASAKNVPLNSVLSRGGLPCIAMTLEQLTGLPIFYAGMLTFIGAAEISTAIGGVPVCVNGPLKDPYSGIDFPEAGTYEVEGLEALAFLRTRSKVGDGSDLGRINLQQLYLSSMMRTIVEENTLYDIQKVYNLAVVVSRSAVLSSSLNSIDKLVSMARTFTNIPLENIVFVQFPVGSAAGEPYNQPGKVAPKEPVASQLIEFLQNDTMFVLNKAGGNGTVVVDGYEYDLEDMDVLNGANGQSAADVTCSKVR